MSERDAQNSGMKGRNDNLDEALNRCLRAIESGQISVEECIARFPQFSELGALLHTALLLSDLPRPPMPTAFTVRTQRRLQNHLRERVRATLRRRAASGRSLLGRLAFFMGVFALIMFAGGAALVRAADSAVPGDTLYPIKRTTEQVNLAFADSSTRPAVLVTIAQTRVKEIGTLAERGQAVQSAWVDEMYASISRALDAAPDQAKRDQLEPQLTSAAYTVMHAALSKGVVSRELANATLAKLQQLSRRSNGGNVLETPTPSPAAIAEAATFTATPTATDTATFAPTTQVPSSTPTDTATSTSTSTATRTRTPTSTPSATFTPTFTATPAAPSNNTTAPGLTMTLGPGPARVLTGIPTSETAAPATQGADQGTAPATENVAGSETPPNGTEVATEATLPATEQSTDQSTVTDTPTNTATSTPTFTATRKPTRTPRLTATPVPPTITPSQTSSPTATPNGLPSQDLKQPWQQITFNDCKPEGDGGDGTLNQTRNRVDEGKYQQTVFDSIAKLPWPKDAEGKHHDQWAQATHDEIARAEGLPVLVEGFLIKAQANGPEAQNCHSSDLVTWQIWVSGAVGQTDPSKAIIAGISPRVRANHAGWTLDKLNTLAAAGAKMRISGWLSFNPEQAGQVGNGRGSLWEIHPAMQISVSQGNQWVSLDDYQP